jgi:hypothetical protein
MAFSTLTAAQIAPGEATKTELFVKIKDNFDDHESRISDVEAASTATIPLGFLIEDEGGVVDAAAYIRVPVNITITNVQLTVMEAGTSGTLEIDIQGKHGAGAFATILSSNITVGFGSGDFFTASAAGITDDEFSTGDFLRLDVKALQTNMVDAYVTIVYTIGS